MCRGFCVVGSDYYVVLFLLLFFLLIPSIVFDLFLPLFSLPKRVTQAQGHWAGSSPPSPLRYVPSFSVFFTRRLASSCLQLWSCVNRVPFALTLSLMVKYKKKNYRLLHVKKNKFVPRRMSTPFFRFRPWNFEYVFYVPLRRPHLLLVFILFFCPWFFVSQDFSEKWTTLSPNIFDKKEEKKKTGVGPRDGHAKHVCKISASISQQRRGHNFRNFVFENGYDTLFPSNYLILV